jgi:RNA polymerase sigma-70 factor, ECF subfamily
MNIAFRRKSDADMAADSAKTDAELLADCDEGRVESLGVLFDRHSRCLAAFLTRAFSRDASDVEDLVQQTFLEVWRSAGRFDERSSVRTWILGVGFNVARNQSRSTTRRRLALASYSEHAASGSNAPMLPDEALERRERMRRLEAALDALKPDLRVAFVMCEIEEVPGMEAARVLGVRPGTIWRRLFEARKILAAALKGAW